MTPAELGSTVRAVRRDQGLRQDQLAGAAGVGVRFLSELERGKPTVRLERVIAVLAALGCTLRVEGPSGKAGPGELAAAREPHEVPCSEEPTKARWSSE